MNAHKWKIREQAMKVLKARLYQHMEKERQKKIDKLSEDKMDILFW